jgi:hypothetical protein
MIAEFLYRITTKIRRFGQTKVRARIMVRFLVNGRIIVAMVRGMNRVLRTGCGCTVLRSF